MSDFILVGLVSFAIGGVVGFWAGIKFIAFGIKGSPQKFQEVLDEAKKK